MKRAFIKNLVYGYKLPVNYLPHSAFVKKFG